MSGLIAWMTGLSGSGKTTIAKSAAKLLEDLGNNVLVLDGDVVRSSINVHLGFNRADIETNNNSFIHLCKDALPYHDVILVPKISPFRNHRLLARQELGTAFLEIYVHATVESVRLRDPKGLYRKFDEGRLPGLVGMAEEVPYEPPESPELVLDTEGYEVAVCAEKLVEIITSQQYQSRQWKSK